MPDKPIIGVMIEEHVMAGSPDEIKILISNDPDRIKPPTFTVEEGPGVLEVHPDIQGTIYNVCTCKCHQDSFPWDGDHRCCEGRCLVCRNYIVKGFREHQLECGRCPPDDAGSEIAVYGGPIFPGSRRSG